MRRTPYEAETIFRFEPPQGHVVEVVKQVDSRGHQDSALARPRKEIRQLALISNVVKDEEAGHPQQLQGSPDEGNPFVPLPTPLAGFATLLFHQSHTQVLRQPQVVWHKGFGASLHPQHLPELPHVPVDVL
jgi:hypothetical protein